MILYNVTISLDPNVEHVWIAWMKDVHIPDMIATGCFVSHRFLKLLNDRQDVEGPTYAIQYFAENKSDIDRYLDEFAPRLRQAANDRFPNQFAAFRTLLEEI